MPLPFKYFVFIGLLILATSCRQKNSFTSINGSHIELNPASKKGVVCMFITPDCPLSHAYATTFQELAKKHNLQFTFFAAVPGSMYEIAEISHFQDSFNFTLPIVIDDKFILVHRWKATVTPQCIVSLSNGDIAYNGSLDNWAIGLARKRLRPTQHYLASALEAIEANRTVEIAQTKPVGCIIESP